MLKKMMLLALAVGALVAFAAPASASASGPMFTNNQAAISGTVPTTFSGRATFTALGIPGTSYSCVIHVTLSVGTTEAHITSFVATRETCEGTGALEPCELAAANATGEFTTNGATISSSNFTLSNTYEGENCAVPGVEGSGSITLTPVEEETDPLNEVTASGTLESTAGPLSISGTLTQETPTIGISVAP
jgi:hypothetical protein